MQDEGFNGTGSRFNSRFEAGSPIYAKQLNDLASGVQASLPQPYTGIGPSVSFTAGGAVISGMYDDPTTGLQVTPWRPMDNGDGTFSIYPATINSLIPCIGSIGSDNLLTSRSDPTPRADYVWNGDGDCYIYLKAGPSGDVDSVIWPSSDFATIQYPTINGYSTRQNDSDQFGHILIALAQKDTESEAEFPPVNFKQFLFNSLWSERHKYSQPDSAFYYFYRV